MFTGLIESIGRVVAVRSRAGGALLEVGASWPDTEPVRQGDSIAVDGVCLTAAAVGADGFSADISEETRRRTRLGVLRAGDQVNLERALKIGDRLGGHLVQGHVDGAVRVLEVRGAGGWLHLRVELPAHHAPEVVEKGSVALNGVSLTVASLGDGWLEVALIPETASRTTLGRLASGDRVHLETDILGKYVARRLAGERAGAVEVMFGGDGGSG